MLVGIDSIEIVRMEKFIENERFLGRYFTKYEADYVNQTTNKTQRLAGLFSAKEAFVKALGIGLYNGIELNEIEVRHQESGKPYLELSDNAKRFLIRSGVTDVQINITHTHFASTAICILS